jgi:hypothetical protein
LLARPYQFMAAEYAWAIGHPGIVPYLRVKLTFPGFLITVEKIQVDNLYYGLACTNSDKYGHIS